MLAKNTMTGFSYMRVNKENKLVMFLCSTLKKSPDGVLSLPFPRIVSLYMIGVYS